MSTPKLIKYWGGLFRLCKENLPPTVQADADLQARVLQMLAAKYANYSWGGMLPTQRFDEMNNYVYSLLESYFEE
jgi:hypothetical protein